MAALEDVSPPSDWQEQSHSTYRAVFTHVNDRGRVTITPVFPPSSGSTREIPPSHYRVKLTDTRSILDPPSDQQRAAKANSQDDAVSLAEQFMREYSSTC